MATLLAMLALLAVVALAAAVLFLHRRASRARGELARAIHDRALAHDRRCDALQDQLDRLALGQRIDHLFDLVSSGEVEGRLDREAAGRLRRYVVELRAESGEDPHPPGPPLPSHPPPPPRERGEKTKTRISRDGWGRPSPWVGEEGGTGEGSGVRVPEGADQTGKER